MAGNGGKELMRKESPLAVEVDRLELLRALKAVAPCVSRRATIPMLSGVSLVFGHDTLTLTATNLDSAASVTINTMSTDAPTCVIIVRHRALLQVAQAFAEPKLEFVLPTSKSDKLTINGFGKSVRLMPFPDHEPFPDMPDVNGMEFQVEMPTAVFADWLGLAKRFCSREESRFQLCGFHLTATSAPDNSLGGIVKLAATDTHRLIVDHVQINPGRPYEWWGKAMCEWTVPAEFGAVVSAGIKAMRPEIVTLKYGNQRFEVSWQSVRFTTRCLEGNFPSVERVVSPAMDSLVGIRCEFNREHLLYALGTAMQVLPRLGKAVMTFTPNSIVIESIDNEEGEISITVPEVSTEKLGMVDVPGDFRVAFNPKYLRQALEVLSGDMAVLRMNGALSPAALYGLPEPEAGSRPSRISLVMPLQV